MMMHIISTKTLVALLVCATASFPPLAAETDRSMESKRIAAFALARKSIDKLRLGDADYELTIARMQRALRETDLSFADVRTSKEELAMYIATGARLRAEALLSELRANDVCTDPSAPASLREEFHRANMKFSELHLTAAELQKYERLCAPKYSTR